MKDDNTQDVVELVLMGVDTAAFRGNQGAIFLRERSSNNRYVVGFGDKISTEELGRVFQKKKRGEKLLFSSSENQPLCILFLEAIIKQSGKIAYYIIKDVTSEGLFYAELVMTDKDDNETRRQCQLVDGVTICLIADVKIYCVKELMDRLVQKVGADGNIASESRGANPPQKDPVPGFEKTAAAEFIRNLGTVDDFHGKK